MIARLRSIMSMRQAAAGAPARGQIGALATDRLENFFKMSAQVGAPIGAPIGAPPDLGDDIIMYIILMAADVYRSIRHANQVLATRYFSEDGYDAIEDLCLSLQTITNWRRTNKKASMDKNQMMDVVMNSIIAKLRQFLNKVNYWEIENRNDMTDNAIKRKIIEMCENLRELYDIAVATKQPYLSRQRAIAPN